MNLKKPFVKGPDNAKEKWITLFVSLVVIFIVTGILLYYPVYQRSILQNESILVFNARLTKQGQINIASFKINESNHRYHILIMWDNNRPLRVTGLISQEIWFEIKDPDGKPVLSGYDPGFYAFNPRSGKKFKLTSTSIGTYTFVYKQSEHVPPDSVTVFLLER